MRNYTYEPPGQVGTGRHIITANPLEPIAIEFFKRSRTHTRTRVRKGKIYRVDYGIKGDMVSWVHWNEYLAGIPAPTDRADGYDLLDGWFALCNMAFGSQTIESTSQIAFKILEPLTRTLHRSHPKAQATHAVDSATRGSRMEIYHWKGKGPVSENDLPSAYPKALSTVKMPIGHDIRIPLCSHHGNRYIELWEIDAVILPCDIGPIPLRTSQRGTYFPGEGKISGWFWKHEIEHQNIKIIRVNQRLGFAPQYFLQKEMQTLIELRAQFAPWSRPLKLIANKMIGMLAHQGTKTKTLMQPRFIPSGARIVDRERWIWEVENPQPYWGHYCQRIPSFLWSTVRLQLREAIEQSNPISCHTDGFLSQTPYNREPWQTRKEIPHTEWISPYLGAVWIQGYKSQAPGIPGSTWHPGETPQGWSEPLGHKPLFRNRVAFPDGTTRPYAVGE